MPIVERSSKKTYSYPLRICNEAFSCCGSATIHFFVNEQGTHAKPSTEQEAVDKIIDAENMIYAQYRKNMAICVLNNKQVTDWGPYLLQRGWVMIGEPVTNHKTDNTLHIFQVDFTKRVLEMPKPPTPANGFNGMGVRLDRRDEPRLAEVGPRLTTNEVGAVKEHFIDINNHRVMFVDLPVFARGQLADAELSFYSIRLANGGNSYSWLQGGRHRFPAPAQPEFDDVDDNDIDEEDEDR